MTGSIVLFFELHQPLRLHKLSLFSPLALPETFDNAIDWEGNYRILDRVVNKTYYAATKILYDVTKEVKGFKVTMSISGVLLEMLSKRHPEVIDLLSKLIDLGALELTAQTYYHSLAWLIDENEFKEQVRAHVELLKTLFGVRPDVAENTEFIYNNDVGCALASMGFKGVITEGVDHVLGWRSPNYVYQNPLCGIKVLLRNYRLSDDIGFRFSDKKWDQYPLTADKYSEWVARSPGDLVVVALDYETFGEHHWPESGIYEFLRWLPIELNRRGVSFLTASEALALEPKDFYDIPPWRTISWADERDLSAWLGNELQRTSLKTLRRYYYFSRAAGEAYLRMWRLLSISDHLYYMATKGGSEGEVHSYFSYLGSPYDAFMTYGYALQLLGRELSKAFKDRPCNLLSLRLPEELCYKFINGEGKTIATACSIPDIVRLASELPPTIVERDLKSGSLDTWSRELFNLRFGDLLKLNDMCSA